MGVGANTAVSGNCTGRGGGCCSVVVLGGARRGVLARGGEGSGLPPPIVTCFVSVQGSRARPEVHNCCWCCCCYRNIHDITLSYTFFKVDEDEDTTAAGDDTSSSGIKLHGPGLLPAGMALPLQQLPTPAAAHAAPTAEAAAPPPPAPAQAAGAAPAK